MTRQSMIPSNVTLTKCSFQQKNLSTFQQMNKRTKILLIRLRNYVCTVALIAWYLTLMFIIFFSSPNNMIDYLTKAFTYGLGIVATVLVIYQGLELCHNLSEHQRKAIEKEEEENNDE